MSQSLLIISRQSPWSGPSAREALDIALAGGAFDLPVGMLFLDDGAFQLAAGQQGVHGVAAEQQAVAGVEQVQATAQAAVIERRAGQYVEGRGHQRVITWS